MKYLFIILAIVSLATVVTFFSFLPGQKTPEDQIALTVNGHDISKETLLEEDKKFGYHTEELSERYDTIITKEVLIQEAQRQAIDKEVSFRTSLKKYYETSLIKILVERKNNQLVIDIEEIEINNYIALLGKTVTFTRLDTIPATAEAAAAANGSSNTVLFDDLADSLQIVLSSLSPGQFRVRFDTGNEQYAIRLDTIQDLHKVDTKTPDRKRIIAALTEFKREEAMNNWLEELKQDAKITIHNTK